jgi:hypothetical protein
MIPAAVYGFTLSFNLFNVFFMTQGGRRVLGDLTFAYDLVRNLPCMASRRHFQSLFSSLPHYFLSQLRHEGNQISYIGANHGCFRPFHQTFKPDRPFSDH